MKQLKSNHVQFLSEMAEFQVTAREFFGKQLLSFLDRDFGLTDLVISYFDLQGNFLSWTTPKEAVLNSPSHPYNRFISYDIIRHVIYQDALKDKLTYFNTVPKIYKSTDVINSVEYDYSAYVRFIEEQFHAHYSLTMAFGLNAYIQITFFKSRKDGDFTEEEMKHFFRLYVYIAASYKTFKKYEQAKIVTKIQENVIMSDKKAYLITDDFMHVMRANPLALSYLQDILGISIGEEITSSDCCNWIPFLLGSSDRYADPNAVCVKQIKDYLFNVHTYDQTYSNGIVDRYHWITIAKKQDGTGDEEVPVVSGQVTLSQAEMRVATLLCQGLSYRAIAEELVLSYHTVKKHVQNIYSKCGVKKRFDFCQWMEQQKKDL